MKRTGKALERYLDALHSNYLRQRKARLFKVPSPWKPIGAPDRGRVHGVLQPPVWVDYSGVLSGGRAVAIEAKEYSKSGPSFPLGEKSVKVHQMVTLADVHDLGGVAALYVRHTAQLPHADYFVPWLYLESLDRRSFRWDDAARYRVPSGSTWLDAIEDWPGYCVHGW